MSYLISLITNDNDNPHAYWYSESGPVPVVGDIFEDEIMRLRVVSRRMVPSEACATYPDLECLCAIEVKEPSPGPLCAMPKAVS